MDFVIYLGFPIVFNFIIYFGLLFLYKKMYGDMIYKKLVFTPENTMNILSNILFYSISVIPIETTYIFSDIIIQTYEETNVVDYPFVYYLIFDYLNIDYSFIDKIFYGIINSGVGASLSLLGVFSICKKIYMVISDLIRKKYPKFKCISSECRMWAFVCISIFVLIADYVHPDNMPFVCNLTLSIVIGKFFWVENKKKEIQKNLLSFFKVPFFAALFYTIVIQLYIFKQENVYGFISIFLTIIVFYTYLIRHYFVLSYLAQYLRNEISEDTIEVIKMLMLYSKEINYSPGSLKKFHPFKIDFNSPGLFFLKLSLKIYSLNVIIEKENNNLILTFKEFGVEVKGINKKEVKKKMSEKLLEYAITYYNKYSIPKCDSSEEKQLPYIFFILNMKNANAISKYIRIVPKNIYNIVSAK